MTNRFNVRDSEDFITVTEVSTGRYLSIAITDANDDPFCDHGYLGDPFLHLTLPPPPLRYTQKALCSFSVKTPPIISISL